MTHFSRKFHSFFHFFQFFLIPQKRDDIKISTPDLAVEALCGVPNDVKIVEPDLNYEIEELAIPKSQQEREMSPGNRFLFFL